MLCYVSFRKITLCHVMLRISQLSKQASCLGRWGSVIPIHLLRADTMVF